MSEFEGKKNAVKDLGGNWWYQDPMTASWYIWTGKGWQWMPGAVPRIAPRPKLEPKQPISWTALFTLFTIVFCTLIAVGGITLVAYNFFPAYHIIPGEGDVTQIGKLGGGGFLAIIVGTWMIHAGFKSFFNKGRADRKHVDIRPGCGEILNGIGRLFFGLLFFIAGLVVVSVVFYQEVLPWLNIC
jgi:hypothetical protein